MPRLRHDVLTEPASAVTEREDLNAQPTILEGDPAMYALLGADIRVEETDEELRFYFDDEDLVAYVPPRSDFRDRKWRYTVYYRYLWLEAGEKRLPMRDGVYYLAVPLRNEPVVWVETKMDRSHGVSRDILCLVGTQRVDGDLVSKRYFCWKGTLGVNWD